MTWCDKFTSCGLLLICISKLTLNLLNYELTLVLTDPSACVKQQFFCCQVLIFEYFFYFLGVWAPQVKCHMNLLLYTKFNLINDLVSLN